MDGPSASNDSVSLKERLTKALLDFSTSIKCGALVQMWMPDQLSDGSEVLSAQGLPFALSGVGDLLALFRCVSVRYRFAIDFNKPALMGAPGRVFASAEPEMTGDVQKYGKMAYLRVTEAQRCKVHSVFVVPVFDTRSPGRPLAVFELVQGEKDIAFPAIMAGLRRSLEGVLLSTTDVEMRALNASLRGMPSPALEGPSSKQQQQQQQQQQGGCTQSSCQILEVRTVEAPTPSAAGASEHRSRAPKTDRPAAPGASFERLSDEGDSRLSNQAGPHEGSVHGPCATSMHGGARGRDRSVHGNSGSDQYSGSTPPTPAAERLEGSMHGGARQERRSLGSAPSAGGPLILLGSQSPPPPQPPQPPQPPARLQLPTFLQPTTSVALDQQQQQGSNAAYNAPSAPSKGHTQSGGNKAAQGGTSKAVLSQDAQALQLLSWMNQNGLGQEAVMKAIMAHTKGNAGGGAGGGAAKAGGALKTGAMTAANQRVLQQRQQEEEEDEIGASSDDEDEDEKSGRGRDGNRSAGGAGKRLRFEDLQAQFGLGLKEAASNLGICATTLKRACRRHGVRRWPRRQIAKLNKALTQMGGLPPTALAQSAIHMQRGSMPPPALPPQLHHPVAPPKARMPPSYPPQPPMAQPMLPPQQPSHVGYGMPPTFHAHMPPQPHQDAAPGHGHAGAVQGTPMAFGSGPLPMLQSDAPSGNIPAGFDEGGSNNPVQPGSHMSPFMLHHHALQQQLQQQQQQQQVRHAARAGQQQQQQGSGTSTPLGIPSTMPSASYSEMDLQFLYSGGGSLHGGTAYASDHQSAMVNELGGFPYGNPNLFPSRPGSMAQGPASMQLSQQGSLLMPLVNKSSAVDMDAFNLSEEELAAAIASEDAAGLEKAIAGSTQAGGQGEIVLQGSGHNAGGEGYRGADDGQGHGFNDMGRTESSQLAAIHELFQSAPGSLESFMELLSDDNAPNLTS